jgi:hypothetical protein
MSITLNQTDRDNINRAVTLLVTGDAPELPYPSGVHEEIVGLVGKAAARSGFKTAGAFKDAMANAPISTLLNFIQAVYPNANILFAIGWLEKSQAEELPLDAQINYEISKAHGSFSQQLTLQQNLQDRPISTLLRFLSYVST